MRVSPANSAEAIDSASIQPCSLETTLVLRGLAPQQVDDLLRGHGLRALWRPGLSLALDNPSAAIASESSPQLEHELADGRVLLSSGRPGSLTVEPQHALANTLIPQSLGLLMAQQLARSGVMMVHGAALCIEDTGVLALGARGSGKSVLSAAALSAGAGIVSDDWLLVGRAEDGRFRAERLRKFLMLRHGWAADRLIAALTHLGARITPGRVKTVLDIAHQPEAVRQHFPASIELDRVWLLQRLRTGRAAESTTSSCSQAEALAGVIAATMPLLFGHDFPVESRALLHSARALVAGLNPIRLSTGLDLVDAPQPALSRLLASNLR